MDKVKNSTFAP